MGDPGLVAFSYGLAALAFLLLGLASRGRDGPPGVPGVALPALASVLWAAILATESTHEAGRELAGLAEVGRNLVWLWYLWRNLRALRAKGADQDPLAFLGKPLAWLAALAGLSQAAMLLFPMPFLSYWASAVIPAILAVAGLVLVEQLYRNSAPQERWAIKYLCLALGGMFIVDFYLYSEAMLFAAYDLAAWSARGLINALLVPLIWVSLKRRIQTDLKVAISHRMAFHTVSLLGTGVYLILMAAAGYYIRLVGGDWGRIFQTVFLFGAVAVLILAVSSGTVRARLRVFLSKHFFRYRYDYREEWLRFTSLLTEGEPGSQLHERALQAMARLVESNGAGLWLRQESGVYTRVAEWNLGAVEGQVAVADPFPVFMENRNWVLDLDEVRAQPDMLEDATLPDWLKDNKDAWLTVPLLWHERMLGFMVLAPSLGKVGFNWEVSDLLKTAARQAAAHLAQAQAAEALTVARQFESFNRAAAFVVHDIKNLVAQLSLLLANAEKHKHKPEFQEDMLATIESSVARMNRMLTKLRDEPAPSRSANLDLDAVLEEVMHSKRAYSLKPSLHIETPGLRVRGEQEKLTRVLGHVVQNAIEATPYTGKVGVTLRRQNEWGVIEVEDTGAGMDEAFIRERLFRPFASTKGTGMGIGAYECREYIQELGGEVQVSSRPGQGTRFTVLLPLIIEEQQQT
ncbi:MAG: XrtA/PEP-CTERM system histidine kinase PrsK [Pseudomonadota bacterium]